MRGLAARMQVPRPRARAVILAIDPGAAAGFAIRDAGELVFCSDGPPDSFAGIRRVVVEGQDFRRRRGGRRISPESIGVLIMRAGAAAASCAAYAGLDRFEVIPVAAWKGALFRGSLPKAVFVERLRRRYNLPREAFSDDAVEAAGLAEAAGKVRGRVYPI